MNLDQLIESIGVSQETLADTMDRLEIEIKDEYEQGEVDAIRAELNSGKALNGHFGSNGQAARSHVSSAIDMGTRSLLEAKAIEGGMSLAGLEGDAHKLAKSLADKRFEIIDSIPGLTDYYFKKRFLETPDVSAFNKDYEIAVEDIDRSWQDDPEGVQKRFADRMAHGMAHAIAGV